MLLGRVAFLKLVFADSLNVNPKHSSSPIRSQVTFEMGIPKFRPSNRAKGTLGTMTRTIFAGKCFLVFFMRFHQSRNSKRSLEAASVLLIRIDVFLQAEISKLIANLLTTI